MKNVTGFKSRIKTLSSFRFKAVIITLAIVAGFAGGYIVSRSLSKTTAINTRPVNPIVSMAQNALYQQVDFPLTQSTPQSFRDVVQQVLPSVVEITTVDIVTQVSPGSSPFEYFFGPQRNNDDPQKEREFRRSGLGSGVIVRRDGNKVYVLTNEHVVGDAEEIRVGLSDDRDFDAELVGKDDKRDLALVVFETGDSVPIAVLGDSDDLYAGDWVLAIGNPLGFESTVTAGIVSAIGRASMPGAGMASFTDYIQTDAAINQGNSGGALANTQGEVVGINAWIASPSGGSIGLGFAIPINNAKKVIDDFITSGKVEYGWLGITVGDVAPHVAEDLEIDRYNGGFVYGVFEGSPADKAGLLPGDYITHIDGIDISDSSHVLRIVGNLVPDDKVNFRIVRGGDLMNLTVTIKARDDEKLIAKRANKIWPGLSVATITDDIREQLELPVKVGKVIIGMVDEGSKAAIAGLQSGDIIQEINDKKINSVLDFYKALNNTGNRKLVFGIYRQGTEIIIGLVR
jgi:Do/DeqQ family serine protease